MAGVFEETAVDVRLLHEMRLNVAAVRPHIGDHLAGVAPGMNVDPDSAVFEATHGSAGTKEMAAVICAKLQG